MAERGAKVLVLERETQFKDRVRGEMIVPWGVAEARELGVLDLLKDSCAHEVSAIEMGTGQRDFRSTTLQQLPALTFAHQEMQETLIAAAEEAGAEVRRGVSVERIEPGTQPGRPPEQFKPGKNLSASGGCSRRPRLHVSKMCRVLSTGAIK